MPLFCSSLPEVHSESCQTSKMEIFTKTGKSKKPLTIFAKVCLWCLAGFWIHLCMIQDPANTAWSEEQNTRKHWNIETVIGRCSSKKVFLKMSENSHGNTCVGVFMKFYGNFMKIFFKEHLWWLLLELNRRVILTWNGFIL